MRCLLQPTGHLPPIVVSLRCYGCETTPSVLSHCAMLVTLWYLYVAARTIAENCKYFCCCCAVLCVLCCACVRMCVHITSR